MEVDERMKKRWGFYFDQTACIGCGTCQVACQDQNDLPDKIAYRCVRTFEAGIYPHPHVVNYSAACNHCEDPACVKGCSTGALFVDVDGTVQHDDAKCIGCQACANRCPYGVLHFNAATRKIGKCDTCRDLRAQGANPACVDACIMRCLEFGPLEELMAAHGEEGLTNKIAVLPDPDLTKPSLLIKALPYALEGDFVEKGM